MAEVLYSNLSNEDRLYALRLAQDEGQYRAYLLEKDIWMVASLSVLFDAPFAKHLTFKGGTSLAKVWRAIRRFSEDVDITYDIRAIAPDLVAGAGDEALPKTRSQQKRWTQTIRTRLIDWVRDQAGPIVERGLAHICFPAKVDVDAHRLFIKYESLLKGTGFVRPEVVVEFGARSTGEPNKPAPIVCDAATYLPDLVFPEACPTVMLVERTFWEKATAVHVFCRQERRRGERLSRHWHDLARLEEAGLVANALADRELALSVARHKTLFFAENDASGKKVDYEAAVSGNLQLVPVGDAYEVLADDYARMQDAGMLPDENEPFGELMERCAAIEASANSSNSQ